MFLNNKINIQFCISLGLSMFQSLGLNDQLFLPVPLGKTS